MSRAFIPQAVRERVAAEARHRCGYCQTQQAVVGMPLHSVHIPSCISPSAVLSTAISHRYPAAGGVSLLWKLHPNDGTRILQSWVR